MMPWKSSRLCLVPAHYPGQQRGFLLITSVVMIVIAAVVLSVMVFLSTTGNQATVRHLSSKQALFIAEAGIEKAIRNWKLSLNPPTPYTGEPTTPFANGTFTVTIDSTDFSGAPLPADQLRFISVGTAAGGVAMRVAEAIAGPENLLPSVVNANFNLAPQTPCNYFPAPPPTCMPTSWVLNPTPALAFQPWDETGGPDGSRAAYANKPSPGPSTATSAGNLAFSPPVTVFA
ncbi:MAG: hypothetical protein OEM31_08485, partial [Gammaproteobacteria bacterium]|nr:hypothetical protein [Gammaproteobacteria bacterium]